MKRLVVGAALVVAGAGMTVPFLTSPEGARAAVQGDGPKYVCHFVDATPFDVFESITTDAEGAADHIENHPGDFLTIDPTYCTNVPIRLCHHDGTSFVLLETGPAAANVHLLFHDRDQLAVDGECVTSGQPEPAPESAPSAPQGPEAPPDGEAAPGAEVQGQTQQLALTGFDSSGLAAAGLALVAVGLVLSWRSQERTARV